MERIAIINGCLVTMDPARRIIPAGRVVIEDGTIRSVEPAGAGESRGHFADVIDARGCAVLPGLVNAHTHLYMSLGRTLGFDQPFEEWLPTQKKFIAQYTEEEFATCVELGIIENLRSGNTCVVDNLAVPAASENRLYEAALASARQLGVRYVLARGYTDQFNAPEYLETPPQIEARLRQLVKAHGGRADDRIDLMLSPMLPWAVSREGFALTRRLATELGLRIHMHTAETQGYAPLIQKAHGHPSNIRVYQEGGCLGPDVQLLGCAFVSPDEIETVRATQTAVILDPTASMYLGMGMPPSTRLLSAGVPVALGTNGVACNGSQDMFESMKNAAGLAKIAERNGAAVTQQRVLELATIEGARALGLDARIGSIEPGKRGDLIIVDLTSPYAAPVLNVVAALVSSCKGRDVRHVLVDGRVVVRDGKLVTGDEAAVLGRAKVAALRCAEKAGLTDRLALT
ncbi:MAG: amidohydrolase, partial [candidate division NC10 bacterium]